MSAQEIGLLLIDASAAVLFVCLTIVSAVFIVIERCVDVRERIEDLRKEDDE